VVGSARLSRRSGRVGLPSSATIKRGRARSSRIAFLDLKLFFGLLRSLSRGGRIPTPDERGRK
jgi:hypothetical protein